MRLIYLEVYRLSSDELAMSVEGILAVTMSDNNDTPRRLLVQMSGAPGSGKSTIASLLSRSSLIKAVIVDHDLLRSFFLDNTISFAQSAKLAYDLQWTLARNLLQQGHNVIVDSTCNYQETLNTGMALAREFTPVVEYWYIECKMDSDDIDLLDTRLRNRASPMRSQRTGIHAAPTDAAAATGLQRTEEDSITVFKKWIESPVRPTATSCNIIVVDAARSPQECLDSILEQVTPPSRV